MKRVISYRECKLRMAGTSLHGCAKTFFSQSMVRRGASSTPPSTPQSASATPSSSPSSDTSVRDQVIDEILSFDKEIFELKRQHELSMLRVEQHQKRILKDQEDRGMYYEQNCNVHTFDTVSVGLHSQRTTLFHTMSLERLRNFKIMLSFVATFGCCAYIYYRYMINPEFTYMEKPLNVLGSRVQAIREIRWSRLTDDEKLEALKEGSHHR